MRKLTVYTNENKTVFVLPYLRAGDDWKAVLLVLKDGGFIIDRYGVFMFYSDDGECLGLPRYNVTNQIQMKNLPENIRKEIVNIKKSIKEK